MCGIVGAWLRDADPRRLSSSLDAIEHRGPDGRGEQEYDESGVMLGHVRLAIIDLSLTGAQPMASDDGRVTLIYNGEIYNFRELRTELEAKGEVFRGHSDSEVLLRLYLSEGVEMLSRLNGIFAFAIYDRRSCELMLARDAMGVKPLYYGECAEGFVFASEIKALLPLADDLGDIDLVALHRYLTFLWCPGAGTPLSRVRKLAPGEALRVSKGRVVQRWTWCQRSFEVAGPNLKTAEQAINAVRQGLRAAVQRQLVADVPVGAFLSGGLDSSAVVAFAREQVPDLRCFTIDVKGADDPGFSEDLPYAQKVARYLGVRLDVIQVDASRLAADLESMVCQLDEPLADPAALNVRYICSLAREAGCKVLLSGAGGDDLFTGYRRHKALRYEWLWSWLPKPALKAANAIASSVDERTAFGRRLVRLLGVTTESDDKRLAAYYLWAQRDDLLRLYSPQFREAVSQVRADQPMLDFLAGLPSECSRMDRMLALDRRFFLGDHNLIYTDKMSMAVGVEVRVPFLDNELVDLAARIPDRFKQRGTVGKWVLKKAMEPYLPREVIWRPKTGFGVPLRRWMRRELRELLGDLLSEDSLRRRGLFDPKAVQQLIADNDAGRCDAAYTLLSLLCIEIWCRKFLPARLSL